MEHTKRYTVITGASSGIGCETAKAFADRSKNLIIAARRTENLETLKREIAEQYPALDVVVRTVDLSVLENVYQFYSSLKGFQLETWVNNAGFGNYDSVAQQDLEKIDTMLRLNVEALGANSHRGQAAAVRLHRQAGREPYPGHQPRPGGQHWPD